MSEPYQLGSQLSDFLRGLLGASDGAGRQEWGRRVDVSSLEHLYAPQEAQPFNVPAGGIDNLSLTSTDVFIRPGVGTTRINFEGYFQVARANPTSTDWADAEVHVNLTDMRLQGEDADLGPITVRPNPNVVSGGQTFAAGSPRGAAKCRIAAAVTFEAPQAGVTLFNKEPILLMNDAIESIPPVEDPNGAAYVYMLPLYDLANPQNPPLAYLQELRYTVGNYITRERAEEIRAV